MKRALTIVLILTFVFLTYALNGCSIRFYRGNPDDLDKIEKLETKVHELEGAKDILDRRLAGEIRDKQVKVEMTKKGLVVTFVNEVLFDSGKADLRKEACPILDKVAGVILEEARDNNIGIEGHTDNQPIKHSDWGSNWELSTARAITVLHYLENAGINPAMLRATGFGEYQPVASNNAIEGRQSNRRVEIVIIPLGKDKSD